MMTGAYIIIMKYSEMDRVCMIDMYRSEKYNNHKGIILIMIVTNNGINCSIRNIIT